MRALESGPVDHVQVYFFLPKLRKTVFTSSLSVLNDIQRFSNSDKHLSCKLIACLKSAQKIDSNGPLFSRSSINFVFSHSCRYVGWVPLFFMGRIMKVIKTRLKSGSFESICCADFRHVISVQLRFFSEFDNR